MEQSVHGFHFVSLCRVHMYMNTTTVYFFSTSNAHLCTLWKFTFQCCYLIYSTGTYFENPGGPQMLKRILRVHGII